MKISPTALAAPGCAVAEVVAGAEPASAAFDPAVAWGSPAAFSPPAAPKSPAYLVLLDRDHSILAFNERVLDWAVREDVPLLERLRYLCIVSSNLDEFFEVRAAAHLDAARGGR